MTSQNNKNDDDLKFMPLNISEPLNPNSSKFPLTFQSDGISVTKSYGTISLGFPSLSINPSPLPLSNTPYIQQAPLTPYPNSIPNLSSTNSGTVKSNLGNTNQDLEFPAEGADGFLYSYNETRIDNNYLNNIVNPLEVLRDFDLSIDLDDTYRHDKCGEANVEEIFCELESKNAGIIATMKAYRIPYPITKLLIKKIIKISLDNCKR